MRKPLARRLLRIAALVVGVAVVLPVLQCLAVRFADPRISWTMVGTAWSHWEESGEVRWPEHIRVPLEGMAPSVARFAVASEDQRFLEHRGFDWGAIEEAWEEGEAGGRRRGASTISQQVARNAFLWQRRSWLRKGLEAWYTVWLELLVPKERILELYLNLAQTGPMCFGVEAGARHWYGVSAADLTDDQAARLVAVLPAPSRYTPEGPYVRKRARWIQSQQVVLPWQTPPGDPGLSTGPQSPRGRPRKP